MQNVSDQAVRPARRTSGPAVDGLQLVERVPTEQASGRGELWRARRTGGLGGSTGAALPGELPGVGECLVRLLRLPVDPVFRARALMLARDLTALDDVNVLRVLEPRPAFDGLAFVLEPPSLPLTSLDRLGRHRMLGAGELVTVGVAVAWALDAAHALDLTHGDLHDADIVLPPGGRPVLAGIGIMGVCGAAGDPRDDVRDLARVLASLLDLESAGAEELTRALEPARGTAPDTAAELAVRLAASTPAKAVSLTGDAPADAELAEPAERRIAGVDGGRHRGAEARPVPDAGWRARWETLRRSARPWQLLVAVAALVLVGSAAIGWMASERPTGRPGAAAVPEAADGKPVDAPSDVGPDVAPTDAGWVIVLERLAAARSAALGMPRRADLAGIDAPGSAAWRADRSLLDRLTERGLSARGLRLEVETVTGPAPPEPAIDGAAVTLRVRDRLAAYRLVDVAGRTAEEVAARPAADHLVTLRRIAGTWRLAEVRDVSLRAPTSTPPADGDGGT